MSVNPRVSEITILGTKDKAENNQNNNAVIATITHDESIDTPLSITNANGTFYYHRDHQGSIIALTDSSGAVVESFTYDNHYGTITKHTKTTETNNPYGYTGRELDTEELYYYRARYYDPMLQRFLGEDPIGFSSGDFNFYRYVHNNPIFFADPSGLDTKICSRALGDKKGSDRSIYNPISHKYLVVNGFVYSFQAGDSVLWSQGRIEKGKNSGENPNRSSCITISADSCYDESVLKAINLVGATKYNILAYPSSIAYAVGARNCHSWILNVLAIAIEIYKASCTCEGK